MGIFDEWHPVPKSSQISHNRKAPKRKARGEFSQKTIQEILERDGHRCVKCSRSTMIESVPHHCRYKSNGGLGIKKNGATVCRPCHDWGHGKRKGPNGEPEKDGKQWFIDWSDHALDENGDRVVGGGY